MFNQKPLLDLGLSLEDGLLLKLARFHELLVERNKAMDLTSVPEDEMAIRHYADSLLVVKHGLIPHGCSLIDVGTGAGFPGLPLAIARPDITVSLLESKQKRCDFLQEAIDRLGLQNARVLQGRAETLASPPHREAYDLATARAVAPLNLLLEYLLPYVRIGGKALCWKGPSLKEELGTGVKAAGLLGGSLGETKDLGIPGRSHYVVAVEKISPTPKKYPRKAGTPSKDPLGV